MKKIFIDSDVVIDFFNQRVPFNEEATKLFALVAEKKLQAAVSSLIFSNLYYVLRKSKLHREVIMILRKLRIFVDVLPVSAGEIDRALISDFKDFEDAIQYFTAMEHKMDVLITRNTRDFKTAKIPVLSPKEFLSSLET